MRSKIYPFFLLATWTVAVAVSSPYLFVGNSEGMQCNARWEEAIAECMLVLSRLQTGVLYGSIHNLCRGTQAHPGEQSSNIEQQRQRRNRNVLCMSIAIISLFVFCWLSFMTNILILSYRGSSTHFSCNFRQYYVVNSMVAAA
ncbi:unnamed protein product [Porites evermanni]|uniref:G-protein coupled receptors family 1 profile domain-containing protein n=1 Tax=Porites evermanni TaxID=104178 RepID=A0ABN8QZ04_9CNID|nr:unnamed protein product [Porites evermanni]